MKNWDIPNMIIEIKKPIIPGMDIPRKRYIPVTEIWRLIFQGIEKVTFEPQVVKKYQNSITQDMEEKIIFMYAKGMATADIESHMRGLYDLEISDSTVSRITDKILPISKRMAGKAIRKCVCCCIYGCDPFPCP